MTRRKATFRAILTVVAVLAASTPVLLADPVLTEYPVARGLHPHDVAPAPDGRVFYTAQHQGALGWLDPETGQFGQIPLGAGSRPHGVIIGPDGAPWITDSGLNAIVRVDPVTEEIDLFPLPNSDYANLNTATFGRDGSLWFTGQSGVYGRVELPSGTVTVYSSPLGSGPYGIDSGDDGSVYSASLAGNYVGEIDTQSGRVTVLQPPTPRQGARRVWVDSGGVVWITGWNSGDLISYDPESGEWQERPLPDRNAQPYAVYVDERDMVWVSDFRSNSILLFDPDREVFTRFQLPSRNAQVRQMLGRDGELWGAESGTDKLVVIRY